MKWAMIQKNNLKIKMVKKEKNSKILIMKLQKMIKKAKK
jgi:hypothetical protein